MNNLYLIGKIVKMCEFTQLPKLLKIPLFRPSALTRLDDEIANKIRWKIDSPKYYYGGCFNILYMPNDQKFHIYKEFQYHTGEIWCIDYMDGNSNYLIEYYNKFTLVRHLSGNPSLNKKAIISQFCPFDNFCFTFF